MLVGRTCSSREAVLQFELFTGVEGPLSSMRAAEGGPRVTSGRPVTATLDTAALVGIVCALGGLLVPALIAPVPEPRDEDPAEVAAARKGVRGDRRDGDWPCGRR